METFIRVAFWTATLFCCLQAKPLHSLRDANIDQMRERVTCVQNSTFYTPPDMKLQPKCIVKALKCVYEELAGPATFECEDPKGEIRQAMEFLDRHLENQTPDNSTECDCHTWPQKPFSQFLDGMLVLLQFDNANRSGK